MAATGPEVRPGASGRRANVGGRNIDDGDARFAVPGGGGGLDRCRARPHRLRVPHDLAIKGPGIDSQVKSQTIQNGGTTPLSVTLQPGSYELWCTVGNHKQMGMDMTIQVS